jgi:ribosomal protein S27E
MRKIKECPKCGNKTWILSHDPKFNWELYVKCSECGYEDVFVLGRFVKM